MTAPSSCLFFSGFAAYLGGISFELLSEPQFVLALRDLVSFSLNLPWGLLVSWISSTYQSPEFGEPIKPISLSRPTSQLS